MSDKICQSNLSDIGKQTGKVPLENFLAMASPSSPNESSRKTEEIKKQVEEVKEILQTNVEMMKNRGEAVESMQGRTGKIADF